MANRGANGNLGPRDIVVNGQKSTIEFDAVTACKLHYFSTYGTD